MAWGVTVSWNLILIVAIGIWLLFAPALFGIDTRSASADSDRLVGALVITLAVIAWAEVGRSARYLNLLLGAWLVVGTWFLSGGSPAIHWSDTVSGLLLILLSLPLGRIRDAYGSFDPYVVWTPGRKIEGARTPEKSGIGEKMDHYRAISDYGVIGNLHTAALVSSGGSIDWACLPSFDFPAFFCRLLDLKIGGYFQIHPVGVVQGGAGLSRESNILSTTFSNGFGKVALTDLMPISADECEPQEILRKVEGVEGEIDLEVIFKPTPRFASVTPTLSAKENGLWVEGSDPIAALFTIGSEDPSQTIGWRIENGRAERIVRVKAGEALYFLLSYPSESE
ncbi:MAG: DUF5911 domain-containing protein (plasmid) [Candidatus Manganitrophus sp.]|nr:MAG: DUF5911 domain-containing protein [Candidatus Manganitrophus sp.]